MLISSLIAAVTIFGLTSASPVEVETTELSVVPSSTYRWRVTQWQACCSSTACTYKCYVQAPAFNQSGIVIPAFKAKCTGRATAHFNKCQMLDSTEPAVVEASLVPLKHPGSVGNGVVSKTMALSLSFVNEYGTKQNYTGHHQAQYNCGHIGGKYFSVEPTRDVQTG